jgi:hypothetical protein
MVFLTKQAFLLQEDAKAQRNNLLILSSLRLCASAVYRKYWILIQSVK